MRQQYLYGGEVHMPITQTALQPELDQYAHLDSLDERLNAIMRSRLLGSQVMSSLCDLHASFMPQETARTLGAVSWATSSQVIGRAENRQTDDHVLMYRKFNWRHLGVAEENEGAEMQKLKHLPQTTCIELVAEQLATAEKSLEALQDGVESTKPRRLFADYSRENKYFWEEHERFGRIYGDVALTLGFIADYEAIAQAPVGTKPADRATKVSALLVMDRTAEIESAIGTSPGVDLLAAPFSPLSVYIQNARHLNDKGVDAGTALTTAQNKTIDQTPRLRAIA